MRRIFSFIGTTVDGYYEGPNQEFDWPNADEEFDEFAVEQLDEVDTLILGRVTYEGMAASGAQRAGHGVRAGRGRRAAAAVRDRKRLAGADTYGQGTVRCLLHHGDL